MPTTSPDDIWYTSRNDFYSAEAISANEASSVQAALSKRERFDFVWANESERSDETGGVQGARGYQVDSKTEYIYDNSSWRLASPLIQLDFNSVTANPGVRQNVGQTTINSTVSSSTDFVSPMNQYVKLDEPGIYSIQERVTLDSGNISFTSGSHAMFTRDDSSTAPSEAIAPFVANVAMPILSYHRTTSPGEALYFWIRHYESSELTFSGWIRIARVA